MRHRTMHAVLTTGYGGLDRLSYREVPVPDVGPGDALVEVRAAGVNNTDVNLRRGWYGADRGRGRDHDPGQEPDRAADPDGARDAADPADPVAAATEARAGHGGWDRPPPFPLIQGADACGVVREVGDGVDAGLLGRRVLVRPCVRVHGFDSLDTAWMGSDFDGAFAQFVRVPASEVFPVECSWSDAELAAVPCAYGTAENMLQRAGVGSGDRVLVTGASGGVGTAAVQLAKRRGAHVVALTHADKHDRVARSGADEVVAYDRAGRDLEPSSMDVVVDNVAGEAFVDRPHLLRRGGRLVTSGAVAGALVRLDLRELYLHDRTLIGTTAWAEPVFADLVRYLERGEIRPVVDATYPLADIARAQRAFLERRHVGKLVLLPRPA